MANFNTLFGFVFYSGSPVTHTAPTIRGIAVAALTRRTLSQPDGRC